MQNFEPGDRVALEHTDDPYTDLRPGDRGTVTASRPQVDQLLIDWDNGSSLIMLPGRGDRVRRL
ncbi:MAG: DUF4314 domain-containing protein [Micromonosporaceae bacterium]